MNLCTKYSTTQLSMIAQTFAKFNFIPSCDSAPNGMVFIMSLINWQAYFKTAKGFLVSGAVSLKFFIAKYKFLWICS